MHKMFSDISTTLNLNDSIAKKRIFLASKDATSDLNFVFSDLFSFFAQRDYSLIIVNLAQSYSHYYHLLLKSGVNVRFLRDRQKIKIIDVLSEFEKQSAFIKEEDNILSSLASPNFDCLKSLYDSVKKAFEELKTVDQSGCLIMIDEISMLTNLGLNLKFIQPFILHCYSLCFQDTDFLTILLIGTASEQSDKENSQLVNYLCHLADIKIVVEGLRTGYSQQVDGKITFEQDDHGSSISSQQKFLFKVCDKGVQLLTLGL